MTNVIPRDPVQKRSRKKKRKLVVAAMKLFADKGFHHCSIAELSVEAGVAVGTFYSYYKDKNELLEEIATSYGNSITEGIYGQIVEKSSTLRPSESIELLIQSCVDAHSLSPGLHKEICALNNRLKFISTINHKLDHTVYKKTLEIIEQKSSNTDIKDLKISAQVIHDSIEKTIHTCIIENKGSNLKELCSELKAMISCRLKITE